MMMIRKLSSSLWHGLASLQLTIVLCLALTVDLAWGYFCLKRQTAIFSPINDIGLPAWLATYGIYNLVYTSWFFLLLLLLALLAINSFVCTSERLLPLLALRRTLGWSRLLLKFAPHFMHYALILILVGYLASYVLSRVEPGRTLVPGASFTLPDGSGRITLVDFQPEYYSGERLAFFKGQVITPRARMRLIAGDAGEERILSCNRPLFFQGYTISLNDFSPKKQMGGMKMKTRIDLTIRKDPGVSLYFAGMVLFTVGLVLYIYQWLFHREAASPCP